MGGVGIAVAAVFVLGLVLAGFILGYEAVFTHTLTFGNLVLAAAGGCLIAFGIFVYLTGVVSGRAVPLAIGLVGAAVIIVALAGFLGSCCQKHASCQCFLCLYAVVLLLLLAAAIVLGIVVAAFTDTVRSLAHFVLAVEKRADEKGKGRERVEEEEVPVVVYLRA